MAAIGVAQQYPDLLPLNRVVIIYKTMTSLKRLLAFGFDLLVLSAIGRLLSVPFSKYFIPLDRFGFLIGVVLFLTYFCIFESLLKKASSPGKQLVGLRVWNGAGDRLNLWVCIARALALIGPWVFLKHILLRAESFGFSDGFWIDTLAISLFLTAFVFPLINRGVTMHDAITRTVVARQLNSLGSSLPGPVLRRVLVTFGLLLFFLDCVVLWEWKTNGYFDRCNHYEWHQNNFISDKRFIDKQFSCFTSVNLKPQGPAILTASFITPNPLIIGQNTLIQISSSLFEKGFRLRNKDVLRLDLSYGFDIGIYSKWITADTELSADQFNSQGEK